MHYNKCYSLLMLLFLPFFIKGQTTEYKLIGTIQVKNGKTYPYVFELNLKSTMINGYSITKLSDGSEPKTKITGFINKRLNRLEFKETVLAAEEKNTITCFAEGKLYYKTENNKKLVRGSFTGKDFHGIYCGEGTIELQLPGEMATLFNKDTLEISGQKPAKEQQGKSDEVVTRTVTKGHEAEDRPKKSPAKNQLKEKAEIPDESGEYEITSGVKKHFTWYSDTCVIDIYDGGVIDGDKITVVLNEKEVLTRYLLAKKKNRLKLFLKEKTNTISIIAENMGKTPPNTANIILTDGKRHYKLRAFNDIGESAEIILEKK